MDGSDATPFAQRRLYLSQGLAAARSEDYESALALLQQAAAVDPDNPLIGVNLARAQENLGQMQQAEATLQNVLEIAPDNASAHLNLGVLDELAGDDAAALVHYQAAVDADPGLLQAQLLAGNAAMRTALWSLAAQFYAAALDIAPDRDELRFRQVVALAPTDCGRAIGQALALVRRLPEDLEVLTLYIRVVATCPEASAQDRSNALNAARNLYRLQPVWPVLESLAMAEAAAGDFEQAIRFQRQLLTGPDAPPDLNTLMQERLDRYAAGQLATRPFASAPALATPRALTAADRR